MQYTIFLTKNCNLACDYCYVAKTTDRVQLNVAERIIDFAFCHTPPSENINIGFLEESLFWSSTSFRRSLAG